MLASPDSTESCSSPLVGAGIRSPSRSSEARFSKVGPMGAQRTTFDKLQRDRAKKAKQAAKRERRQEKATENAADTDADISLPEGDGALTAAELMQQVEAITRRLEAG